MNIQYTLKNIILTFPPRDIINFQSNTKVQLHNITDINTNHQKESFR